MTTTQPHAVVTGATSGIGRWIARGLAQAGYGLTLIARDEMRADKTHRWIAAAVPGAAIDIVRADLSSLKDTRAAAASILSRHPKIDLLVNNAGLLSHDRQVTPEGREKTLATNLLSPLALTEALLPAMVAPARIVMVGSSSADRARIDPDDLELRQGWRMTRAYARSKLALLMMSGLLAERLKPAGITVNVVHPGLVATNIVRHGGIDEFAWRLLGRFALTAEQGADTPLYACLSPELAGQTGLYLKRRRAARPNARVRDPALVARVEAAVGRLL
ncbi:SDR family NAD(P)-dependent oxidoreductase [Acidisoma cellulosilytica]|uniref:SDR family NAD(P)-dependent oxidoreductase n=1 Tax=Acidisoma cellulosilyticum TaxID=2802395 RepID=A0A963Z5L4_9PROT|nr:SDR family NAD(P)-dependent oxidoreductase [Acidisoma cellulosilyticum]MCB8883252.1 SDR family NAD(P)-dependent oxidoreductase [Acidisoma cellulosilyticum]